MKETIGSHSDVCAIAPDTKNMQVTGTFPALSAGMKKTSAKTSTRRNGKFAVPDKGVAGFGIKGRAPRAVNAPKSFAGRRAASHRKAYGAK